MKGVRRLDLLRNITTILILCFLGCSLNNLGKMKTELPQDVPLPRWAEAPDSLKIAFLGTSITANSDWPDYLVEQLQYLSNIPIETVRIAKPGAGSAWGLTQISELIQENPDLAIVEFAVNDADLFDGVSLKVSISQQRKILSYLHAAKIRVLFLSTNPASGFRSWIRPKLGAYYNALGNLANETGTGFVDGYARWLSLSAEIGRIPDGLHPSASQMRSIIVPPLVETIITAIGRIPEGYNKKN